MKLVGSDLGRVEHEEFRERLLIAPSERWVVDVYFPEAGEFVLEHASSERSYRMATFAVSEGVAEHDYSAEFARLRHNPEFGDERERFAADLAREPDKVLLLQAEMPGMDHHMDMETGHPPGASAPPRPLIEWEDDMPEHNAMSTPASMHWHLTEEASGRRDHDLHWVFRRNDRVKIRIVNDPDSDHPMQHPIHFHGQRFYELEWEGHRSKNLMWKDTVLVPTGKTVDILLECSNPGSWMVHCHIAEHLEAGMMFTFEVREAEESRKAS